MPEFAVQRQEFLSLYSRSSQHIYKTPTDRNWKVSRFRLASGLIDAAISTETNFFYGAFWGSETAFAVLDIDKNSNYHNAQAVQYLRRKLTSVGLSGSCLFQSSNSSGWHLYLPFAENAPCKELERTLKSWLKIEGYEITCGQLEVFPSGNALRLPLQRGFGWLDEEGNLLFRREQLSIEAALTQFFADLKTNQNSWMEAKNLINSRITALMSSAGNAGEHQKAVSTEGLDQLFTSKLIKENYERGREYWQNGLLGKNQRHDAILFVEHYLWHGDPMAGLPALPGRFNDKTRFRLIRSWLEEKHNGFSWHVSAGNWRAIEADIERACTWRGDSSVEAREPYPCTERAQDVLIAKSKQTGRTWTMDDLKKGNDRRERAARSKIRRAVRQLLAAGQRATRNAIARKSKCSPNTVSKHRDLWSQLVGGSGDQSRGVLGGSSPSQTRLVLVDSGMKESLSSLSSSTIPESSLINRAFFEVVETTKVPIELTKIELGKTPFILPYDSQRRPSSDSLPVSRVGLVCFGFAAAAGGVKSPELEHQPTALLEIAPEGAEPAHRRDFCSEQSVYRLVIDSGDLQV